MPRPKLPEGEGQTERLTTCITVKQAKQLLQKTGKKNNSAALRVAVEEYLRSK